MREFYRNGELISIRLENDNFIYFRHHDEFCAYWFREIIVLYEDGSNTTYSALRCRGDLSGTCLHIQYRWKTVNHDDSDDRCRSNSFCGVFNSRGINDYYYDEFTLCGECNFVLHSSFEMTVNHYSDDRLVFKCSKIVFLLVLCLLSAV